MESLDYMYKYNSEHKMNHHHHHHRQYHHQYHHHYHDYHNNNQVSPRISFSNDFVDAQLQAKRQQELIIARAETASSDQSDFEFSAAATDHSQYSMISADELFFKGRLLPFKNMGTTAKNGAVSGKDKNPSSSGHETASSQRAITTTLREELLQGEDDVTSRPAAGKGRWKSLLGLKRAAHGGGSHSKKAEKGVLLLHDHQEAHVSKAGAQELMNEEVEFGI